MKYMYLPLALLISASYCAAMECVDAHPQTVDINAKMLKKYPTPEAAREKLEGPCTKASEKLLKNPHSKKAYAKIMKCLGLFEFAQKRSDDALNELIQKQNHLAHAQITLDETFDKVIEFRNYLAEYRAKYHITEEEALKADAEYLAEDDSSVKTELPNE